MHFLINVIYCRSSCLKFNINNITLRIPVMAQQHVLVSNWNVSLTLLIISIQHSSSYGRSLRPVCHSQISLYQSMVINWSFMCSTSPLTSIAIFYFLFPPQPHQKDDSLLSVLSPYVKWRASKPKVRKWDTFVQRGCPTSLLQTAFRKASQIPRSETLTDPVSNVTTKSP